MAACWQSCRFCQDKFFVSSERLLEHEISCPVHLQVQQLLQQQQQQQNDLQQQQQQLQMQQNLMQQLKMQQNLLQQQFIQQQNLFGSSFRSMFGSGGLGQFMSGTNNLRGFQTFPQASLSQNQDLESLLQPQQQTGGKDNNEQQPYPPVNSEDEFESAINNLPDFQNQHVHQQRQAQQQPPQPLSEPKPLTCSSPSSATVYFPLAMLEDEEWLTPLHCFVRKYCVEVFVATPEDEAGPCMGKRNPVSVNQVGIRCPYCSPRRAGSEQIDAARARENSVVYPSIISRIYNSSINLLQRHIRSCAFVPPEILVKYEELKSSNARSGASKKYWADSASRLGLLDTPSGIRLDNEIQRAQRATQESREGRKSSGTATSVLQGSDSQAPPLVLPFDKRNATAFTFHLMSQMQLCVFTEADRLGRRRNLKVGFAGLACRHCFGAYGSGRFFPSSVKTMADASKTLDVIYRHVMKCKKCPCDIKGGLRNLRDIHDSERSKMPFGNQRAFFVKIWGRLHEASVERVPRALLPSEPTVAVLTTTASATPSAEGVKTYDAPAPTGKSLQGLYAMVKRESGGCDSEKSHKKLVTEAA